MYRSDKQCVKLADRIAKRQLCRGRALGSHQAVTVRGHKMASGNDDITRSSVHTRDVTSLRLLPSSADDDTPPARIAIAALPHVPLPIHSQLKFNVQCLSVLVMCIKYYTY